MGFGLNGISSHFRLQSNAVCAQCHKKSDKKSQYLLAWGVKMTSHISQTVLKKGKDVDDLSLTEIGVELN